MNKIFFCFRSELEMLQQITLMMLRVFLTTEKITSTETGDGLNIDSKPHP